MSCSVNAFAWLRATAIILCAATTLAAGPTEERALATRSVRAGETLFTTLPSAQTGIVMENKYDDPKMWGERYQELTFGAIGTGVAIADFDNDGRPDVCAVGKTEGVRLFRNLGEWKFVDVTASAGLVPSTGVVGRARAWLQGLMGDGAGSGASDGAWYQGVTFADVDNDGWLDLYLCRLGAPNLLFMNQRNGTFVEQAAARGLAIDDASGMAGFCDYDRDGWLDVYIQTNMRNAVTHPHGQRDHLLRNRGDGTFVDVTERAGIRGETAGHSATWWDFDDDGWPDLHVANDFATSDSLYRNNRDGTFTNVIDATFPHTTYYSMGADLGDVNNDGLLDLYVADMAATTHEKDHRGMAGSRARAQRHEEGDLSAPQYMRNALYLNTGTGRFREAAFLAGIAASDWTWSVRLEDLDNDGRVDLHMTNGMNREYHNADILDQIMVAGEPAASRRIMRASPPLAEANLAFRNRGDLEFENVSAAWGLDRFGVSFGGAFGDLDGDGDLDLVHANFEDGLSVLRNDSPGGHRVVIGLRGTTSNRFGVGATVRVKSASGVQVRQLVLARGSLSSSEPVLHFGLGEDPRIERITVRWPDGREQVFSDLAVDRSYILTEDSTQEAVREPVRARFTDVGASLQLAARVREGAVDETVRQPLLPWRFDRNGPALAVGDLDGDGRDDIVLGGTAHDPARVWSAGTFHALPAGNVDDGPIVLLDANADGAVDILITRGGGSVPEGAPDLQPTLFLNDGRGASLPAPPGMLPALAISAGAAAAADFDRDGVLDVFIGGRVQPGRYPLAPRSALLAYRDGAFVDVTDALAPGLRAVGMVTSAIWSDVDDDGWPDLVVALEWGGIRFWRNNSGRGFEDRSEAAGFARAGDGWWSSLASGDFNRDGRPDFVAGNVGLNTRYRASADQPALLFLGEARAGGASLLVEAYFEEGRLYPWRTRNEFATHVPAIARRFPKHDLYARATLAEILGESWLAGAQRWAASELRSGVFLSQRDGSYGFEPLPRDGQIAPVQGIAAADFDGDGNCDLMLLHNSFTPSSMVGRFDGGLGLFLSGDGRGGFAPATALASGFIVPGDARALVVTDLDRDGWPDVVASRNDAPTLAFRNGGDATAVRRSLRVTLRGTPGNPFAAGARVTTVFADSTTQVSEIGAGSSLLSQSVAACFVGYSDANPPREFVVRWPSGRVSRHGWTGVAPQIELSTPDSR